MNSTTAGGVSNRSKGKITIQDVIIRVTGNTTKSDVKTYGIYNNTGENTIIENTTIQATGKNNTYGVYNESTGGIEVKGGTITATEVGTATAYGIYNSSTGTITIGEKGGEVNTETPEITGTNYGMYNVKGIFNFYDGKIKGPTAIHGQITMVEPRYITTINQEDGMQTATLTVNPTDEARAFVNGTYYETLQAAVDACNEPETKYYIMLMNGVSLGETLEIDAGQDIVIDLMGNVINGGGDYAINNNGTLTITDTENEEGKIGTIRNAEGTVIRNNGTLTIGTNDESVSVYSPLIEGQVYGIENLESRQLNFYDGVIKGTTNSINGGTVNTQSGYILKTEVVNGAEITTLIREEI